MSPLDEDYPIVSLRIATCKIMLEHSLFAVALEILSSVLSEDETIAECWYLSGWAWLLAAESESAPVELNQTKDEILIEAKDCLQMCLQDRLIQISSMIV